MFLSSSSDPSLFDAIRKLKRERQWLCAVAFLGNGAEVILAGPQQTTRIICNLKMGGTNPAVVRRLMAQGIDIRQHDTLHAKVYIGDDQGVVTSANASANGLGFQGVEQAGWEEAGVLCEAGLLSGWFDSMLNQSRPIEEEHLVDAERLWRLRRRFKGPVSSVAEFDFANENYPLLSWWPNKKREWNYNPEAISQQLGGFTPDVARRMNSGYPVFGNDDRKALQSGRWLLWWTNGPRKVVLNAPFEWIYIDSIIDNCWQNTGENFRRHSTIDAPTDRRPPEPFDIRSDRFRSAFSQVISKEKFRLMTEGEDDADYFTSKRLALTKKFWADLQAVY